MRFIPRMLHATADHDVGLERIGDVRSWTLMPQLSRKRAAISKPSMALKPSSTRWPRLCGIASAPMA